MMGIFVNVLCISYGHSFFSFFFFFCTTRNTVRYIYVLYGNMLIMFVFLLGRLLHRSWKYKVKSISIIIFLFTQQLEVRFLIKCGIHRLNINFFAHNI